MIQAARIIGTGLATTGLIGAGVGIGVVFGPGAAIGVAFGALMLSVVLINYSSTLKVKNIKTKIFSKRFLVSLLCTIGIIVSVRYFFFEILGLNLSTDILDATNLSFCTIIASLKAVLQVVLDQCLPHSIPMGTTNNNIVLYMDNKSDMSTSKLDTSSGYEAASSSEYKTVYSTKTDLDKIEKPSTAQGFEPKEINL